MYRCAICNVISRDLREHDKHLNGKRHKRNFEIAVAGNSRPAKQTPPISSTAVVASHGNKRQRLSARDQVSVNAALERLAAVASAETEALFERMLADEPTNVEATTPTACAALSVKTREPVGSTGSSTGQNHTTCGSEDLLPEIVNLITSHLESTGGFDRITRVGSKFNVRKAQLTKHFYVLWPEGSAEHFVSLHDSLPQREADLTHDHDHVSPKIDDDDLDGEPLLQSEFMAVLREERMLNELAHLQTQNSQASMTLGGRSLGGRSLGDRSSGDGSSQART